MTKRRRRGREKYQKGGASTKYNKIRIRKNKGRSRSRSSNNRRKKGATKENSVHQIGNVLNGSKKSKKKKKSDNPS